jgi:hypothetical protein
MFDLEEVVLILTAGIMSSESDNSLFKEIDKQKIPHLIERSQFNKGRRKLFLFLEEIRTKLTNRLLEFDDYIIVESMSSAIWKF